MAKKKTGKSSNKDVISGPVETPLAEDKWKHERDFGTLSDAEEIKADPERMKYALKHGKKKLKAIRSVTDLINYRNKKYGPKESEMEGEDIDG